MSELLNEAGDPKCIADAIAEIDKTRERVGSWLPTAQAAVRAIESSRTPHIQWRLQCAHSPLGLEGILIVTYDVMDLKHVIPLLRALRREGYRVQRHEDWQEIPSRTYHFESLNGEREPHGPIVVRAFFPWNPEKAADASCRFVQTGTKEVPVMEIVCDGATTPELTSEVTG